MSTDWISLNHEIPDGFGKYVMMLAEACSADNELKLLVRFQKVVRLIHDAELSDLKSKLQMAVEALETVQNRAVTRNMHTEEIELLCSVARETLAKIKGEG